MTFPLPFSCLSKARGWVYILQASEDNPVVPSSRMHNALLAEGLTTDGSAMRLWGAIERTKVSLIRSISSASSNAVSLYSTHYIVRDTMSQYQREKKEILQKEKVFFSHLDVTIYILSSYTITSTAITATEMTTAPISPHRPLWVLYRHYSN